MQNVNPATVDARLQSYGAKYPAEAASLSAMQRR
jgi:hypothetical protein